MADSVPYLDLLQIIRQRRPRVAFILGSGLGDLDLRLCDVHATPFPEVPGLARTSVPGHKGCLILGEWAGAAVLVFSGRLHGYEGHAQRCVTGPIHIARDLGVEMLVLTNAAGGIRDDLVAGTLMVLADHLPWMRPNWWRAPNLTSLARPTPYDVELRQRLQAAAAASGFTLPAGTYAQVTGPCYETKAEIRALRHCGADAVGMSTAHEVDVANALGLRCAAISCITNRAAGLSDGPIHHGEVLAVARQARERLAQLLERFLGGLENRF